MLPPQTSGSTGEMPVRIALNSAGITPVAQIHQFSQTSQAESLHGYSYAGEPVRSGLTYICVFCESKVEPLQDTLSPCSNCYSGEFVVYLRG